jgi:membrane protein DedA with SNARE-associated domain/rhodanese-related sulfurtransferase
LNDPLTLVTRYGLALVFANVLAEQLGLPIPAVPTLIVAGALAMDGALPLAAVFASSLLACMIADGLWFAAGRRYGLGILKFLCRVSLSPDSCVRETESRFERWGAIGLMFGKFIPGVSTVASPLAGAMRIGWSRFLLFNTFGSLLWSGAAIGTGVVFNRQITALLDRLEHLGLVAVLLLVALLATFIAFKWWQRQRFYRTLRLARISVAELRKLMDEGREPIVVDVRSPSVRALDGRYIPGALAIDLADIDHRRAELAAERDIVFYCTCPNEASAAVAAKRLMQLGYPRVRPLLGGLDQWIAAGYEIERR